MKYRDGERGRRRRRTGRGGGGEVAMGTSVLVLHLVEEDEGGVGEGVEGKGGESLTRDYTE